MNDEMKMLLENVMIEIRSIKTELDSLKDVVVDMQNLRRLREKVFGWVGGIILALLSTDAIMDLLANHLPMF